MSNRGNIRNFILTAGLFLLQTFLLPAQNITIKLDKDTIGFSETVILRLTAEARNISSYAVLTQLDGVAIVRQTGDHEILGSKGEVKITQTFTLSPYKVGTFTIGPAWVQSGSNRLFSNKVQLVIRPGNGSNFSNEVFMRCEPDKRKARLGEQISLSVKLYVRRGVSIEYGVDRPLAKTFNGFWYQEGLPVLNEDSAVLLNGFQYRVLTLFREYVYPNTTGKLKIPSYEYLCYVKQNPFPTGDPMVDDVMGIPTPFPLISPEVSIEVLPLPQENKPPGFAGDVGQFSLSATLDKENAKVNEAIKLTVTISGKGNIRFVQLPTVKFPAGIESYPPVSDDSTSVTVNGVEGNKTFTITLIPKKEGKYTLPGISFSYFDPEKKEYVTIQTPEFKLSVAPGNASQDVSENNLPESFLENSSAGKITRRVLWIALPAILLLLLFYYSSRKKRKEKENDSAQKEAVEIAELPMESAKKKPDIPSMLLTAEQLFMNGRIQSGIAQLYETLLSAVLFKTELDREEASIHQLRYRLNIKKFPPETVDETIRVLEELSAQRYSSPETDPSKLSGHLGKIRQLALALLSRAD